MSSLRSLVLFIVLAGGGSQAVFAEFVMAVPGGVFPTGTSVDAIAGGLILGSFDLKSATPALPSMDVLAAAYVPTGATATNTYSFKPSFAATPAFLSSAFSDFSRSATLDQRATAEGHVQFKVDVPAFYAIEGSFVVVDSSGFGKVEFEVELLDITAGFGAPVSVFTNKQVSESTTDQTFMVGGTAGDAGNMLSGAPTGLLDPTKIYAFRYLVNTIATGDTTAGATASGGVSFTVTSVPEPSSFCLTTGIALACFCRRKRIQRS